MNKSSLNMAKKCHLQMAGARYVFLIRVRKFANKGQGGNPKLSWAFKRDYETSWLMAGKSLTAADWWNANTPTWYKPNYEGPLTMDSVLCAVNHFNQDNTYKLPGTKVRQDGTPTGEQKEYNAFCKRTDDNGISPSAWNIPYNMGFCLIRFQNSGSNGSDTPKRDVGSWGEWEIESMRPLKSFSTHLLISFRH